MRLGLIHETRYRYTPQVETAHHVAYLRPLELPWQQVLHHTLEITPTPPTLTDGMDIYGNTRVFFSLPSAHDELVVTARSEILTSAPPASDLGKGGSLPWEQVRDRMRFRAGARYEPAAEFIYPSPYVPRHDDFLAYARPSFAPGTPLLVGAADLMQRIHTDFTYESQSTQVNTPAVEALALRKGVCQDFAHIGIACLRALGLPARYVSGYLLTQPPPGQARLVGSDASHAWMSVYTPADDTHPGRWHDLDPTNNRQPAEDYITVAYGRDYADVSPMRGVIHGGHHHTLSVGVTVEPLSESEHKTSS